MKELGDYIEDRRIVETEDFMNRSDFSRKLNAKLRNTIKNRSSIENWKEWEGEFDNTIRPMEIAIESILRLNWKSRKTWSFFYLVGESVFRFLVSGKKDIVQADRTIVNTSEDIKIPFIPDEGAAYAYMIAKLGVTARTVLESTPTKAMKTAMRGYSDLYRIGGDVFREVPTEMPRYTHHNNMMLKGIQRLDPPNKCLPSLHIADELLHLQAIQKMFGKQDEKLIHSVEYGAGRVIPAVLYTKQHGLVDVAFGMLLAKIVTENRFGVEFDDFTQHFDALEKRDKNIPYHLINEMYREALGIYNKMPGKDISERLVKTVNHYLKEHGYKTIPKGMSANNLYFDLETMELKEYNQETYIP